MLLYDLGGFRLVECSYHVFTWGLMSQFCLSMKNVPFGTAQCRILKDSGRFLVKLPRGVRVNCGKTILVGIYFCPVCCFYMQR